MQAEIDKILQKAPVMVVFDMKDLKYMSSAGIRVILKTQDTLKKTAAKLPS